ncbi:LEAF RUST 10 DISEASE-RESISTANCE LOCUS RECEPTOR-LIKE PROTEIN KINASE-like 1.5 [Brachypodium distachyon]|uniref:LEAF RUST 10 DISEASE-RESISTANCE LOCUS RECEPTOR-LIKE PROTEIN KINASE-like 1.5 n=1 Tax=Brachypodium distachyon TaxID=15368 RepID=UPI0001C751E3|nr:LEAF RUST 10 DISEASE-RESISTANCE LOCUS RECEPTOR-LIKE PROTEIN KINASE-like 1.5 [Brachypodium distachyon]|eukprot:XP_003559287.1 LEAF RUST 10 DISEASE-RESISTANCE LOCUS RECEPTOR-LIKE PROTEIN KINASE-like 1.5 [Brachypodium distachyon]
MPPHVSLLPLLLLAAGILPPAAARHSPPPPPAPHQIKSTGGGGGGSSNNVVTTALVSAASLLVVLLLYLCAAIAVRRFRPWSRPRGQEQSAASSYSHSQQACRAAAFLRRHGLHHNRPAFTYEQLRAATAGFDASRKLGDGGFGTVFLGYLPPAGRPAAVKRLHVPPSPSPSSATITKSFCNEVLILSALRHPNLVRLHGFCADPRALLLVYDFVPNGTLSHHLHRRRANASPTAPPPPPPLPWRTRLAMAAQIASALEYLHFGVKPHVVHRDVTSSNIFLEADMRARLGDFGLSRLLSPPDACSTAAGRDLVCCTAPQGTPGYLDPDYHRSFQLTEKSDVYSLGVVVLELVTGLRPVDVGRERRDVTLADWVVSKIQVGELREVVDPPVLDECPAVMPSVEAVAELAFRCVAPDKDDRPDAREVLAELRRIQGMLPESCSHKGS